jgi:chromosome segregation ATPase
LPNNHNKQLRGELGGFVGLVFDAVQKKSNVIDEIMGRSDIPDDLAKAFDRVYGAQIQKIQEALQIMITKWGIGDLYVNINSVLESEKERKEVEDRISEDIERRLSDFDKTFSSLGEDKTRLERKVLELERELSLSFDALRSLEAERDTVRREYENGISDHALILDGLKAELRRLEEAKEKLQKETARSEEDKRRVEEELSKINGLSEGVRNEVEELKSENGDLRRRKEEMDALIDSFREEDVFFDGITKEDARLREIDYVKRVEGRLKEMPVDGASGGK